MSYRKLGCYKDNGQKKRPLPQLLFTDRHYLSPVYSGRKFIKESFDRSYLDDLVGRCASKCKQLGYDIFGIGKFGKGLMRRRLFLPLCVILFLNFHRDLKYTEITLGVATARNLVVCGP